MDWKPPVFLSEKDFELGKIEKKRRLNPVGENVFLRADGWSIKKDEDKIVAVQRIWKHEYYKPGGKGFLKAIAPYNTGE
jgi:hypothetical protein